MNCSVPALLKLGEPLLKPGATDISGWLIRNREGGLSLLCLHVVMTPSDSISLITRLRRRDFSG
jgi:hypothetical protein